MMNGDRDMKPKPYEAQNTKFSEYERSFMISCATFELSKFENRTEVIIKISRFSRHDRPGINEGVFVLALVENLMRPTPEKDKSEVRFLWPPNNTT